MPDCMVVLFFKFWETSVLFSTVAILIYITTNSTLGFAFSHILAKFFFFFFGLSDNSHSNRCKVVVLIYIMVLIYISLIISNVEHLFILFYF